MLNRSPNDYETVSSALSVIPSDERHTWVQVGMSVKAALGEQGIDVWMNWSQSSSKFNEKSAISVWKSFKPGKIGPGTLFYIAKNHGWTPNETFSPPKRAPVDVEALRRAEDQRKQDADAAAFQAQAMLKQARWDSHPYFASKGLEYQEETNGYAHRSTGYRGLVLNGMLLLPMINDRAVVRAIQTIDADGVKKFQPYKCSTSGLVHSLGGRGKDLWFVEGYATGLSVYEALLRLYRDRDRVLVAFSAHNMSKLAKDRNCFVIADHDSWHCGDSMCRHKWDAPLGEKACPACGSIRITPPAGQKAAEGTGRPWWMSPDLGFDANDHMVKYGIDDLTDRMRDFIRDSR